jgi:hypothetical protein
VAGNAWPVVGVPESPEPARVFTSPEDAQVKSDPPSTLMLAPVM